MKKRMGFVSNSSSSSFCILGTVARESWFDEDTLEEGDFVELVNEALQGTGLGYVTGIEDYYEEIIVGRSPDELEDDVLVGEHKRLIAEKIQEAFRLVEPPAVAFHVDGGHEG